MKVKLRFYNPKNKPITFAWDTHCIPNVGESVVYNKEIYTVIDRIFNYDENTVCIMLCEFFHPDE